MNDDDKLITPSAAAELVGVNVKTLQAWSRAGKVPHVRTLGGHRRYRPSDLRAIQEQATTGT